VTILGAVACGHPLTAAAAEEILRDGGNAFDAILAAQLMACVAEPVLASLGGGGFLLAQAQGQPPQIFDFFPQTPRQRAAEQEFYPIEANFGTTTQTFHIGLGSAAVPGSVAGMFAIHSALASLPLSRLAEPAVSAAQNGITINDFQGYIFDIVRPIYQANSTTASAYASAVTGERLRQSDLAGSLAAIARDGAQRFYGGEIAAEISKASRLHGGHLTDADLANYAVIVRQPFEFDYRGARVLTNPPPSAGGVLIALTLKLLEALDLSEIVPGSADHLSALCNAMSLTSAARTHNVTEFSELVRIYQEKITSAAQFSRGTTHISVIDNNGNSAAMTLSNGEGCGHLIAGTGIMLNNMLGEADINPTGVGNWPVNVRLGSMMAPTLIEQGATHYALGSGGSNRIRSAIAQVISQLLDFAQEPAAAVNFPRAHLEAELLSVEAGFDSRTATAAVDGVRPRASLQKWDSPNLFFGGVHLAALRDGIFAAAGDPRRGGCGTLVRR